MEITKTIHYDNYELCIRANVNSDIDYEIISIEAIKDKTSIDITDLFEELTDDQITEKFDICWGEEYQTWLYDRREQEGY